MNNVDALRISGQRDEISEWAVARFRELMEENRIDDAISFADEFFEWLDPNNYINESTHFYNVDETQNSTNHSLMNEQIRGLILKYIEAENNKDHALAEDSP